MVQVYRPDPAICGLPVHPRTPESQTGSDDGYFDLDV